MMTRGRITIKLFALAVIGSGVALSSPDAAMSGGVASCGPVHCYFYGGLSEKHGDWEDAESYGWTLLEGAPHSLHEDVELNSYHAHLEADYLEDTETHSHNSQGCSAS